MSMLVVYVYTDPLHRSIISYFVTAMTVASGVMFLSFVLSQFYKMLLTVYVGYIRITYTM